MAQFAQPASAQAQPAIAQAVQTGQPRAARQPASLTLQENSKTALQEIVVTANKRSERLNKVGLTVTAISGQDLAERRITTLSNIAAVVPGLAFAQSNGNTPILTLRGVGFNSDALGSYPAVAVYSDQIPLPFPVLASHAAYDLERIEVLKGPQGTLFGENSTGGAINFIAAKPTPTAEAGGDISYGRFNDVQGNAYLSGPISDTLRARIAGNFDNADGWQISNSRPYDRNGKISYGAGRLILDWSHRTGFAFRSTSTAGSTSPSRRPPNTSGFFRACPQRCSRKSSLLPSRRKALVLRTGRRVNGGLEGIGNSIRSDFEPITT